MPLRFTLLSFMILNLEWRCSCLGPLLKYIYPSWCSFVPQQLPTFHFQPNRSDPGSCQWVPLEATYASKLSTWLAQAMQEPFSMHWVPILAREKRWTMYIYIYICIHIFVHFICVSNGCVTCIWGTCSRVMLHMPSIQALIWRRQLMATMSGNYIVTLYKLGGSLLLGDVV